MLQKLFLLLDTNDTVFALIVGIMITMVAVISVCDFLRKRKRRRE